MHNLVRDSIYHLSLCISIFYCQMRLVNHAVFGITQYLALCSLIFDVYTTDYSVKNKWDLDNFAFDSKQILYFIIV